MLLESVGEGLFLELAHALPHDQYLAKCGEWQMLQRIQELPERILLKVSEMEDRDHAYRTRDILTRDKRLARVLNTPNWDDASRDLTASNR